MCVGKDKDGIRFLNYKINVLKYVQVKARHAVFK